MFDGQPLACYQPFIDTATGRIAGVESRGPRGPGRTPPTTGVPAAGGLGLIAGSAHSPAPEGAAPVSQGGAEQPLPFQPADHRMLFAHVSEVLNERA